MSEQEHKVEEEEEEDFMSDKFIIEVPENKRIDETYSDRRRRRLNEGSVKGKIQSRAEREKDARREGLARSLFGEMEDDDKGGEVSVNPRGKRKEIEDEDILDDGKGGSKALRMMLSMGFKPGKGIGKHLAAEKSEEDEEGNEESSESDHDSILKQSKSIINPLHIDERWLNPRLRSGIGITPRINPINEAISKDIDSALKVNPNQNTVEEDFRLRTRQAQEQRHTEKLLVNARKTCQELDSLSPFNMTYSPLWINPESLLKSKQDLPLHVADLIDHAFLGLDYMTDKHDQASNQGGHDDRPGEEMKKEDTESILSQSPNPKEEEEKQIAIERALEAKRFCFLSPKYRLQITLSHLRRAHHYCLFCGHRYANQEELLKECPGEEEEDH